MATGVVQCEVPGAQGPGPTDQEIEVTTDPFAQQSVDPVQTAPVVPTASATAPADPYVPVSDMDDPFLTREDVKTDFRPSPNMEALRGRLCVMIPRSLDPAAKDPNNPGETRELYTVDLAVLDGGPLKFFYKEKGDPERGTQDQLVEYDAGNIGPGNSQLWAGYWVPQRTLLGALKVSHRAGRPYLGIVTMIPVRADRDKGMTNAQVEAAFNAWEATGRRSNRPRYTWSMEMPDAAGRAAAVTWWRTVGAKLAPINTATAPIER